MSKNNEKLIKERNEKDRIRQKRYRERKKNEAQIRATCEPYACRQTLGKI